MKSKYLFIILLFFFTLTLTAQTRRALVIGLGMQADKTWEKINGDKDVAYVKDMLYQAGYKKVMTLINEKATKRNIVSAFNNLTAKCGDGDVVYIHFSGHGQRMTDINSDEIRIKEKDRYDESWIPYDAYMTYCEQDKGEKHLSDDEIAKLLSGIKTKIGEEGEILVVVDACHSGGSTRGDDELYDGLCIRGAEKYFEIPERAEIPSTDISEQWLTLSACKDYQVNAECVSPKVGKLTYILHELRRSLHSMSNDEFLHAVSKMMNSPKFKAPLQQDPTLSEYKCDIKRFFQR